MTLMRVRIDSIFVKISKSATDTEVLLRVVITFVKTSQRSGIFVYTESKTQQICLCKLEVIFSMTFCDLVECCC